MKQRILNRRSFLTAATGLALAGASNAQAANRPNFLFILIDDQAWNAMGHTGRFPFLKTPHMDRLAREGASFENAFVTTSLCSPSRASFLTGCHAHLHDVRTNERQDYDYALPTFATQLHKAGYETAWVGKWHQAPKAGPRPGFDYWLSFRGQGTYTDPELNENGRDFKAEGYMTDILTQYATDWLKRDREKPFCLTLSHKAVHGPFTPAPRHAEAFPDAQLPEPPNYADDLADKPRWMRRAQVYGASVEQWRKSEGKDVPDRIEPGPWHGGRESQLNYLRALLAVDESLGHVLDTLDRLGVLDNTVVIYTSDNGYFLGEHGRGDKRLMYEESLRIPLLLRYPKLAAPGSRPEEMVLNIDIAPTMLDLAGLAVPETMQGRSLAPLLAGKAVPDWREAFFYAYHQEGWLPGLPTTFGVRTKRWKFIHYPEVKHDIDELYDLETDPYELDNLIHDPEHQDKRAEMQELLGVLLAETGYRPQKPPEPEFTGLELALAYDFEGIENGRVPDLSGNNRHGLLHGGQIADTPRGKALALEGSGYVNVPEPDHKFSPAMRAFTVGAWCRPETTDGVLVSFGGQSHGFSLYLREGRPYFAICSQNILCHVRNSDTVERGADLHLAGVLTQDLVLRLYVNGRAAGETKADGFILQAPNEGFTLGGDPGSPVGDYERGPAWNGLIHDFRLYWGELPPEDVAQWAKE